MSEERELTCIGCPLGCSLRATLEDGAVTNVTGNTCERGAKYARTELVNPCRTVTSTVCVKNGEYPVVSVKTASDIPKKDIFLCMKELKKICVAAPVEIGQILCENVAGTGVSVVATKSVAVRGIRQSGTGSDQTALMEPGL